jgi:hypothetical protein
VIIQQTHYQESHFPQSKTLPKAPRKGQHETPQERQHSHYESKNEQYPESDNSCHLTLHSQDATGQKLFVQKGCQIN